MRLYVSIRSWYPKQHNSQFSCETLQDCNIATIAILLFIHLAFHTLFSKQCIFILYGTCQITLKYVMLYKFSSCWINFYSILQSYMTLQNVAPCYKMLHHTRQWCCKRLHNFAAYPHHVRLCTIRLHHLKPCCIRMNHITP